LQVRCRETKAAAISERNGGIHPTQVVHQKKDDIRAGLGCELKTGKPQKQEY
jgi:hypothetical protein